MKNQNEKDNNSRRSFLGGVATAFAGLTYLPGNIATWSGKNMPHSSASLTAENSLPIYNVSSFGAAGDGVTLNTTAIQSVIDKCNSTGGGIVFFPPGNFLTGTIQIKTNVNLYLSPGSTISGSTNISDYENGCLIYAEDAYNISITGTGTINGNGKSFWGKSVEQNIGDEEMAKTLKRPGRMMKFLRCNNMLLEGVTIENSPSWTINPIDCDRVTITGISVLTGVYEYHGPNTDGIDPDGCSNVRISDCYLQCGDDCIVLKITNRPGGKKVCRDIVVTNCVMETTQTALKIGSETFGEFRNITFSNCVIHEAGNGFGIWMNDGGLVDGVVVSNITMDCTRIKNCQGIYIWSHRRTDNTPWGKIRNVIVSDMTIKGGGGVYISGGPENHIEGLTLDNIRININDGRDTKHHEDPPYPTLYTFSYRIAPCDIFCRYVDDLKLRNIKLTWSIPENVVWGSALRCWHVKNLEIAGFDGRQSLLSNAPAIGLKNVNGAFIYNCRSPEGTGTILQLNEGTENVTLIGNEFSRAKTLCTLGSGVDANELFETGNRLPG
jgi:polygalacturonase